jgi:predicted DNA-binding transcriptional regulator YafY
VAEILSHGEDVQVMSPPELQALVVEQLKSSLEKYK